MSLCVCLVGCRVLGGVCQLSKFVFCKKKKSKKQNILCQLGQLNAKRKENYTLLL